jgi:ketosteroid isomerase-like protein
MSLRTSVIFMALVCFGLVSPSFAKKSESKPDTKVKALVEQHCKALSAHDLKGVMDTYSSAPVVVLMGTGPGETYVGEESVGGAYNQFFTRFEPNTLKFSYDWITVGSAGNVAWFAATITAEGMVKNEKRERAFNISGTVERKKGKWGFLILHFSRLGAEQQVGQQPK